jgi:hypothetical protein
VDPSAPLAITLGIAAVSVALCHALGRWAVPLMPCRRCRGYTDPPVPGTMLRRCRRCSP